MRWMSRSMANGSWPTTHSASPRQILCDSGASMIALATSDDESTSPTPTMPASVCTLTTSVSWLPSQRSLTSGSRRWIGSTRVIFTVVYVRNSGVWGRADSIMPVEADSSRGFAKDLHGDCVMNDNGEGTFPNELERDFCRENA